MLNVQRWANKVHSDEQSSRPSVVSDDLVQSVDQKICERWHFTISEHSYAFSQISYTVIYKSITVRLGYNKFCARWVAKMLKGADTENVFGFDFFLE
jgi:hypothetical protein